jgi:hypothetical protein
MRKKLRIFLVVIGIIAAILVVKAVLFFTAKPKVTVDYVAEYNRITRPENYDPNENAAPYYQKAFDAFVEMPDELQSPYNNWPTDYLDFEQAMLENWLAANSQAFEFFKIAANKPYYWLEKQTDKDKTIFEMLYPEFPSLRDLTRALLWNAKLNASKGLMPAAIENILTCYKVGKHQCRSSLLVSQHRGLEAKKDAVSSTLVILNNINVDSNTLKSLQDGFSSELDGDTYVPSIRSENLFLYDSLQRYFIDNGKGTGRLVFNPNFKFTFWRPSLKLKLYYCFFGPTRNQTIEQIEKVSAIYNQIMTRTPWQIKNGTYKYFEEIEKINNSNLLLQLLGINPTSTFHLYHKTKTQTQALLAVLAILRFKTDNGRLPATLDELVSTGYLKSVPMDPYSDGSLVYKPSEDNFKLYSVGEDFSDDGGVSEIRTRQESRSNETHTVPYIYSPDIVYWPYKDLKKLYNAHFIEMGKIRKKTERNLLILYSENAEPNEIGRLKDEWWEDIESEFAKYPKEYPDINKIRRYKEDWWGVIEEETKKSLEKADQNQPK